jgi:hypothetical protein
MVANFSLIVNTMFVRDHRISQERILGEAVWLSMYPLILGMLLIIYRFVCFSSYYVDSVAFYCS